MNDDGSQYTITAGSWDATLDNNNTLSLCRYAGNPDDYYLELKSRMTEMGYTIAEEKTERLSSNVPQDTGGSCVYTKDEDKIWVSCDFSMHYFQIYH